MLRKQPASHRLPPPTTLQLRFEQFFQRKTFSISDKCLIFATRNQKDHYTIYYQDSN